MTAKLFRIESSHDPSRTGKAEQPMSTMVQTRPARAATQSPVPYYLLTADSTDAYLRAVREIPLLSAEEERRLAVQVGENDQDAAQKLILSNLRFVVHIARGYLGYGLPFGDLIQEGNIGLMKAVKRFDPDIGVRLISFAVFWIKAEIHEFILRNWRIVRTGTSKAQRKLFFNLSKFKKGQGWLSRAEADAVAAELKVDTGHVLEMEQRMAAHDLSIGGNVERTQPNCLPEDLLSSEHDDIAAIDQADWNAYYLKKSRAGLGQLDPRSRDIVHKRFLQGVTLEELAKTHRISVERVRQIQVKALRNLRSQMELAEAA